MPAAPLPRILYVEDNDDLRETLALLLDDGGREWVACADGEAAWAQWSARGGFDVVVLDRSLPGLSGDQLARRILAERPGQPLVLCSGHAVEPALLALGPRVHALLKPFEVEALEALLAALGGGPATASGSAGG
ncbi:response regulator [Piscinibacter sakaiensis]|nr:response regulator [Piscinibacter sakaiensis]